jgi:1-acyl-sn-glycerol-3-phosphate acyltransferase
MVQSIAPYALQNIIWIPTNILLKGLLQFRVRGRENVLKLKPGLIFACNHTSELDPIFVPASMPFLSKFLPTFYVSRPSGNYSKSGWRNFFYGGTIFKLWGAYPAYIGQKNYEFALQEHIKLLKNGGSICIYPEGGISDVGEKRPARGGAAYLSYKFNAPIIPVAIKGARKITLSHILMRQTKVTVTFGKAIFAEELFSFCNGMPIVNDQRDDFKIASESIMEIIRNQEKEMSV